MKNIKEETYKRKNPRVKKGLGGERIIKRVIIELYNAGMNKIEIARELDLSIDEVKKHLPEETELLNGREKDKALIAEVVENKELTIKDEALNEALDEKRRFEKYALVESKALNMMIKLLDFYDKVENGDLDIDKFKAMLATSLIRSTQLSRDELLQRFKIETKKEQDKIKIEFISKGIKPNGEPR